MKPINPYALNISVFFCGAAVMALELTGARILAPYLGTSIFVWTSLIGVILASLSIGNFLGGVLADRKPQPMLLSALVLVSGLMVGTIALAADPFLMFLQGKVTDVRTGSALAGMVLFAPPALLLGTVAPYAIRLKLNELSNTGRVAGSLNALSTMGSIAGTFLTGFLLLSHLSHRSVILIISATLIIMATIIYPGRNKVLTLFALALLGLLATTRPTVALVMGQDFTEYATPYNRVWIYDAFQGNEPIRVMQINDTMDSCMYLNRNEPVLSYAKHFEIAEYFVPGMKTALLIGGGAYTFPSAFAARNPDIFMDVVEIDPELVEISKKHFGYQDRPNLSIHHEDGRTFLNRNQKNYDAIYIDAYRSYSIPFQLATREAAQLMKSALNEDGIVIMNVISAISGEKGMIFRALLKTMKDVFPEVNVYAVHDQQDAELVQSLIITASKRKIDDSLPSPNPQVNEYLTHRWDRSIKLELPVLTDDYAPVERYAKPIITSDPSQKIGIMQARYKEFISQK